MGSGNIKFIEPQMQAPPHVLYKVTTGVPLPKSKPCKAAYCDKFGDPNLSGLCSSCYSERLHQSGHQHRAVPLQQKVNLSRSSSAHETAPPSSASLELSSHSHSAPISPHRTSETPTNEQQYTLAMKKLERSVRSSVRQCKTLNCTNFGNPKARGFCNECAQREATMSAHRHSYVGTYRNGGYDECDLSSRGPSSS